jgi:hypothetical protein
MADDEPPNENREHKIGYRHPPLGTRFRKGQSGNAKGRPKGSLNLSTLIEKELAQKVFINENGQRKRISKKHAIAKQIVNKAATGDQKFVPLLLNEDRLRERDPALNAPATVVSEEDARVMANLLNRIRQSTALPEPNGVVNNAQAGQPDSDLKATLQSNIKTEDTP